MKRLVALVVACAVALSACNSDNDPDRLRFEVPRILAAPVGPVTFTVAPDGVVYYAELRTFDVYSVRRGDLPQMLFHSQFKPDSLAVDDHGSVFVAARTQKHLLYISRFESLGPGDWMQPLIWIGGRSHFAAHLAVAPDGGLIVGWHTRVFRLHANGPSSQKPRLISSGYTDPLLAVGEGNRLWVADNALPGQKERVRPGERSGVATDLPPYTNPSGATLVKDELLVCSRTHHKVYRLHIGTDDAAHWRKQVGQLACDRDIVSLSDGSVITAQTSVIYRYPPR